jgi:release factor glutamine methyltransferase
VNIVPTNHTAEAAARRERALLALVDVLKAADYRFTTISPASHAHVNARPENAWARNERDMLGSDLVPDYMTSVRDGGFYG